MPHPEFIRALDRVNNNVTNALKNSSINQFVKFFLFGQFVTIPRRASFLAEHPPEDVSPITRKT